MTARGRQVSATTAGFSLLEVLIAMLVLSVGAASVLALFAAAATTHRRAVDRTQAALLAERVFGELRTLYTHGKTAEELSSQLQAQLPAEAGTYRYEALVFHPEGEEWQPQELYARVTIRWRESGNDRAEAFHTVLLPRRAPAAAR